MSLFTVEIPVRNLLGVENAGLVTESRSIAQIDSSQRLSGSLLASFIPRSVTVALAFCGPALFRYASKPWVITRRKSCPLPALLSNLH
jgi:hypothetical protein